MDKTLQNFQLRTFAIFIIKIHQKTTNYSYIVDVSVSIRSSSVSSDEGDDRWW